TETERDILVHADWFIESSLNDARHHEQLGNAPAGHTERARKDCAEALTEGISIGRASDERPLPPVTLDPPPFTPYVAARQSEPLRIVLVSSGYRPNLTGGIARYISDIAPELARLGHEVRVFTRASETAT